MLSRLNNLPLESGVYLMKDARGTILYIGKAKNLRSRVKQYFIPGRDGREMVPYLTQKVADIEVIVVPSEKEALLLENTLIKKHQPQYNILLKDDKTYISISVSLKKKWPMITISRHKGLPPKDELHFGPFTSAFAARQTLQIMQKIFPLRQCSDAELASRKRPCILYGIKQCIAPCVNKCTKDEYDAHLTRAIAFLKGDTDELTRELEKEMHAASDLLEFEKAAELHQTIRQIKATTASQKALVHSQKKECDVFGIYRFGNAFSIIKLIFREGKMAGAEPYYFRNIASDEDEIWENFLLQHYQNEKTIPEEILIPFPIKGASLLSEIIGARLHTPQKGVKHELIEMAQKNAAYFFREEEDEKILLNLQELLHLGSVPLHIDCFDTSHVAGSDHVASCISYIGGKYEKSKTRLFSIKTAEASDDYGALKEAILRHYNNPKTSPPDLLLVDGGKGQRNMALKALEELSIASIEVVSVAKDESLHTKGLTQEKIFVSHKNEPILLPLYSAELQLFQRIRDEAHRVAIEFHKKKRQKRTLRSSLDDIPGIGPKKRKLLLDHFGSLRNIRAATEDMLSEIPGLTTKDKASILSFFNEQRDST